MFHMTLSQIFLLITVHEVPIYGLSQDFQFVADLACSSMGQTLKSVLFCASTCAQENICTGFVWSSLDKQCVLVYQLLLDTSSTGPCRYFLRPHIKALRQKCPSSYNIAVPSSPDRLFMYTTSKRKGDQLESRCTSLGGSLADMYQGNTMLEMKQVIYDNFLSKNRGPCNYFSYSNVQCNLAISAKTINGVNLWIPSNASFAPMQAKFDTIASSKCSLHFCITVWLNRDRQYLKIELKCASVNHKIYLPICQC